MFWALLILRNLQTAYMVEKIASAIEKEIRKKENKTFEKKSFFKGFLLLKGFLALFAVISLGRGRPSV